ncbi:hypothetical protein F1880_010064 [Penicillium rolfsii]|nr:hypothetical protein F1880_010064 [Penicillium rolfsii]
MVTGVEVAGLTLAVLPLFVNQLDDYIRGIEKVRGMRRYRREYKAYSVGLNTQYVILLNTLEQALEGVVDDEDEISKLITEPRGAGWKEPSLQSRLHLKLGRNYDVFLNNMTGLWELLRQLSERLEISATNMNV